MTAIAQRRTLNVIRPIPEALLNEPPMFRLRANKVGRKTFP
ncbi:MAG: hypothetical protein WC729_13495 [Sphingomonas sp.]|jgi:hypothetical protein